MLKIQDKMIISKIKFQIPNSYAQPGRYGIVLLEVVLSLSIFFIAAAIIFGGMSASTKAVQTIRTRMHATDLAVTKISELKMGLIQPVSTDLETFDSQSDRLKDWQWRIDASSAEATGNSTPLTRVTVTIVQTVLDKEYQLTTLMPETYGGKP